MEKIGNCRFNLIPKSTIFALWIEGNAVKATIMGKGIVAEATLFYSDEPGERNKFLQMIDALPDDE